MLVYNSHIQAHSLSPIPQTKPPRPIPPGPRAVTIHTSPAPPPSCAYATLKPGYRLRRHTVQGIRQEEHLTHLRTAVLHRAPQILRHALNMAHVASGGLGKRVVEDISE